MTLYSEPGHLPYPEGTDAADGPAQLEALTDRLAAVFTAHTTATRDALAGTELWVGRTIWNVTTGTFQVLTDDSPVTWADVGISDHGALAGLGDNDHPQYILKSTATAKGDLLVATASGVITRKAVGADGRALVADSAQADGLAWADLSATYQPLAARTAKAYRSAALNVSTSTTTDIGMDAESWDSNSLHDNATNNSRITLDTVGYWLVIGQVGMSFSATGLRAIYIRRNGSTYAQVNLDAGANSSIAPRHQVATIVRATATTDYVSLALFHDKGSDLALVTGEAETFLQVAFLGT